jgi:hypothetical protein
MPLRVDVPTVAQFVAMTGPTVFVGALLMLSLLETNWKGMFYLLGLLVTQFTAGRLSANTAGLPGTPPACTLWQLDAIGIPSPSGISLSTCMYMYTAAYFITPMLSQGTVNGYVIALLVLLTALDTVYLRQYYCNSWLAILFGGTVGAVLGLVWVGILSAVGASQQFYFTSESSAVVCNKPAKQTFRCKVTGKGPIPKK